MTTYFATITVEIEVDSDADAEEVLTQSVRAVENQPGIAFVDFVGPEPESSPT